MARAFLSLGSNIGDKRHNIAIALDRLAAGGAPIVARSHDYRTQPWGVRDQDWFVNCCVETDSALDPQSLLRLCLDVEQSLGRVRERRWGPRIIDIDILTYDAVECESAGLTLPHPRMLERAFVLVPLAEIAPGLVVGGVPVRAALERIGSEGIERWEDAAAPEGNG